DPQQAKGEPLHLGVLGATGVAFADAGEELVRGKRQAPDLIDLIEEEDETAFGRAPRRFTYPSLPLGRADLVHPSLRMVGRGTGGDQRRQRYLADRRHPAL